MASDRSPSVKFAPVPQLLSAALAAITALNAPASALDYTFAKEMMYWSPLNTIERDDNPPGFDDPPYCRIAIDLRITYMEIACLFSKYDPEVWRDETEDDFFFTRYGSEIEKCYFRFYKDGEYMVVVGCKLGGTWTRHPFWLDE